MLSKLSTQLPRKNLAIAGAVAAVILVLGVSLMAFPSLRARLGGLGFEATADAQSPDQAESPRPFKDAKGRVVGLQLSAQAVEGLQIKSDIATRAIKQRALPPQSGTINYDTNGLFPVPSRFNGELVEVTLVDDEPAGPSGYLKKRPLRYGDRVKQGQLLAVVYSQPLGAQKAALVDAVCSLKLSQERLDRQKELFKKGVLSQTQFEISERQVQADSNAVLTAERSLLLWQMSKEEVQAIKDEANIIQDQKLARDADAEAKKWGRVEIRVPVFDATDMSKELVIVEKNTSIGSMVDPINTAAPLFRVADMNRLQIWAHPPGEYLPLLRNMLEHPEKGPPRWDVRFLTDSVETPPQVLEFFMIAPSMEPFNHSPMVIGYLDNPRGNEHVVGQFVSVTLYVAPYPDTVEIPTDALNEVNGESLVFVQPDEAKSEYVMRRVVVVARFKDKSFVRSKLTAKDELQSQQEVEKHRHALEPLQDGERVVTRAVLELTACLEDLTTKANSK